MVNGVIEFVRIPVVIDQNGSPDTTAQVIASDLFQDNLYDNVQTQILDDPDSSSNKFIIFITGRRLT